MSFSQGAALLSLLFITMFVLFGFVSARNPGLCLRLPRNRSLGIAIGLVCLFWAAFHVSLMLEGSLARYRNLVFALAPVIGGLTYFFLSYLFTRALGGLLLLFTAWLLHAAFTIALPARPLFSITAYLIAAAGALLIATPWLFRDLLEQAVNSPGWRRWTATVAAMLAGLFLIFAIAGRS